MGDKQLKNYEQWLALSESERDRTKRAWNPYSGEGYGFALTAAGRLVINSPRKILQANAGIFHGGDWIIHAYVSVEDFPSCPRGLADKFEGFNVTWMSIDEF